MNKKYPKYSIIIPTYNGVSYLPTCVKTIINQDYENYELIISDDHSTDGTIDFLKTLYNPKIKIFYTPVSLSMTEHWEWALSHAKGEWRIFVGQDDGLQSYFFRLADKLTDVASAKGLRTIMSSRAYYFWKGCEYVFGDIAVSYTAINHIKIHNFKFEAAKVLLGMQDYFELPQMYTTALFHKDLLDVAKLKQNGEVFTCHPQDANLAAIACSLEKEYLKSYIPLGWVGTSPKSAGMAISGDIEKTDKANAETVNKLKTVYQNKIKTSKLQYHKFAGDFSFSSSPIYFWQALLMTSNLRGEKLNRFLISRYFKIILFSCVLYDVKNSKKSVTKKKEDLVSFNKILFNNQCNYLIIFIGYILITIITTLSKIVTFPVKALRKLHRLMNPNRIKYHADWDEDTYLDLIEVSTKVQNEVNRQKWIQ